jgi:hypothetical protein
MSQAIAHSQVVASQVRVVVSLVLRCHRVVAWSVVVFRVPRCRVVGTDVVLRGRVVVVIVIVVVVATFVIVVIECCCRVVAVVV